jgi:hypothetical protein
MKLLILIPVLIFAIIVAMALLSRMLKTQSQLADLHKKLATNDEELASHRRELERIAAGEEAREHKKKS